MTFPIHYHLISPAPMAMLFATCREMEDKYREIVLSVFMSLSTRFLHFFTSLIPSVLGHILPRVLGVFELLYSLQGGFIEVRRLMGRVCTILILT